MPKQTNKKGDMLEGLVLTCMAHDALEELFFGGLEEILLRRNEFAYITEIKQQLAEDQRDIKHFQATLDVNECDQKIAQLLKEKESHESRPWINSLEDVEECGMKIKHLKKAKVVFLEMKATKDLAASKDSKSAVASA